MEATDLLRPPGGSRASVASPALGQNLDTWAVTDMPKGTTLHRKGLILCSPIANVSVFLQGGKA